LSSRPAWATYRDPALCPQKYTRIKKHIKHKKWKEAGHGGACL
jgi:hypothetical protein